MFLKRLRTAVTKKKAAAAPPPEPPKEEPKPPKVEVLDDQGTLLTDRQGVDQLPAEQDFL